MTAVAAIPGVPDGLMTDWLVVRKDKKAGTLTQTAVDGLVREATKAGLTAEEAVRLCIEHNWISLNAGWDGVARAVRNKASRPTSHNGLASKDYHQGISSDGTLV